MPIYTFKCPECEKVSEHLVKVDGVVECPDCKIPMGKQIEAPHIDKYGLQKFMFNARGNGQL